MKTILLCLLVLASAQLSAQEPTHLKYGIQHRAETDAANIATLKRKGWKDAPMPAYNAATQHPPAWVNGAWAVANKTQAELDAENAAAADKNERQQVKAMIEKLQAGTATAAEQRRCIIYILRQLQ